MLSLLYAFIFILIQLKDFALVAGSLGLFVILGGIMYISRNIEWNKDYSEV
ncbi:MAG: inner membrane CreD family protein [Schleiferiaceae bacterium]